MSRISSRLLFVLLTVVLLSGLIVTPSLVSATEHKFEMVDGNQYWYGQDLEFIDDQVDSGEDWTIQGQNSGNSHIVTASEDGSVTFDPTNLASDSSNLEEEPVDLIDPSGSVVLTFDIGVQTLSPQTFSNDPVYNAGADTETTIEVQTNRTDPTFDLEISETSGNLTSTELESLNDNFTSVDSTTVELSDVSGDQTITLDFTDISTDTYTLEFASNDAVEPDGEGGLVTVSGTQSITVEEATGIVEGSAATEDEDYTGDITLTLEDQNSSNEYVKVISGPSDSFSFNNVDVSTYDLTVTADRHETQTVTDIDVTRDDTTSLEQVNLPLSDTVIDVAVDVDTLSGDPYERDLTVTLTDEAGDTIEEKVTADETPVQFVVDSEQEYTVEANDRFVDPDSSTVVVDTLGTTYNTTLVPVEQERGDIVVDATTEESVEEIRVSIVGVDNNTDLSRTISGDSGTASAEVAVGDYEITVEALKHETQTATVTVTSGETVTRTYDPIPVEPVEVSDTGQHWVGQHFDFSSQVNTDDTARFTNQDTNDVYEVTVSDGTDFVVDSEEIKAAAGVGTYIFSVNDTDVLEFSLSDQTLSGTFTSDVSIGGSEESTLSVGSNRDETQIILVTLITLPDGTTAEGAALAEMNDNWTASGSNAYATMEGEEDFYLLDFSSAPFTLEEGEYTFEIESEDSLATTTAIVTMNTSTEIDIEDLEADVEITENKLLWTGQIAYVSSDDVSTSETYRILKDDTLVSEMEPRDSDGRLIFNTSWSDFGSGDYRIEDSDGNDIISEFLVRDQSLSVEFAQGAVLTEGAQTTSEIEFTSNRSNYSVIVELDDGPEELSASEIANRASNANIIEVEEDEETVPKAVITSVGSDNELIDMAGLEEGSYTFLFDVMDSTASTTDSIEVRGLEEGDPEFSNRVYTGNQGDVIDINVLMHSGVDTAVVQIGRPAAGYTATIELTDPNPNSSTVATIEMDTSLAGQGVPSEAYSVSGSSGEEGDETQAVSLNVLDEKEISLDGILEPARYLIQLRSDDQETDIAAVEINPLNASFRGLYVLPQTVTLEEMQDQQASGSEDDEGDSSSFVQPTFFGDADSPSNGMLANPDTGILAIELNGLGGQLFEDDVRASDFVEDSSTVDETGTYLTIEHVSSSKPNRPEEDIPVSVLDYQFNEDQGMIYFIIKPQLISEARVGQTFQANFVIDERNPALIEGERDPIEFTTEFTITETGLDWGMETVEVEPDIDQPITVQTNYTPGVTLDMVALGKDTRYPFLLDSEAEVQPDGTATGTFDLRGAPLEMEFEVELQGITDPHPAVVVEDASRPGFAEGQGESEEVPEEVDLTIVLTNSDGESISGTLEVADISQDIDGSTTVTLDSETEYTINVSSDGYQSESRSVNVGTEDESVTLTLDPEESDEESEEDDEEQTQSEHSLAITFVDESTDQPVEDATVSVGGQEVQTDAEGEIDVTLSEGTHQISIDAEGYESWSREITLNSDESTTISLSETESQQSDGENGTDPSSEGTDSEGEEDDSVRSDKQPGFGVLLALLALGVTFMVWRRKQG